jgi:hypothetical protein
MAIVRKFAKGDKVCFTGKGALNGQVGEVDRGTGKTRYRVFFAAPWNAEQEVGFLCDEVNLKAEK